MINWNSSKPAGQSVPAFLIIDIREAEIKIPLIAASWRQSNKKPNLSILLTNYSQYLLQ